MHTGSLTVAYILLVTLTVMFVPKLWMMVAHTEADISGRYKFSNFFKIRYAYLQHFRGLSRASKTSKKNQKMSSAASSSTDRLIAEIQELKEKLAIAEERIEKKLAKSRQKIQKESPEASEAKV